jgi:hypothetical protein
LDDSGEGCGEGSVDGCAEVGLEVAGPFCVLDSRAFQTFLLPFLTQITLRPGPSPALVPSLVQEEPTSVFAWAKGIAMYINPRMTNIATDVRRNSRFGI